MSRRELSLIFPTISALQKGQASLYVLLPLFRPNFFLDIIGQYLSDILPSHTILAFHHSLNLLNRIAQGFDSSR